MTNSNAQTLISVVMSVYNDEMYLSKSIESILTQTYKNFEFIIFDDCSTDNTATILDNYAHKDNRIQIITNTKNKGLTKNLNRGLDIAKGEYIARMDSDDIALPRRFEKQIEIFQKYNDIILCGCAIIEIDKDGKEKSIGAGPEAPELLKWYSIFRPGLAHPTAMFRSEIIKQGLRYNEAFKTAQDYEFWSRMQLLGKAIIIQIPLLKYRKHAQNVSNRKGLEQAQNSAKICFKNISINFPSFYKEYGEENSQLIADYLYLNRKISNQQLKQAIGLLLQLQKDYIHSLKTCNNHLIASINRLTIRWIIQAVLEKRKTTYWQKVLTVFYIRTSFIYLIQESALFINRRFTGRKSL